MNETTMEKVADLVFAAIAKEGLMNKGAAEIFGFSPVYLSCIVKKKSWHHVSKRAWEIMHDWSQLGIPLKEYKSPLREAEAAEDGEAEKIVQEAVQAADQLLEIDRQDPAQTPTPTREEKKKEKADRLRKHYERSRPPKKEPKSEAPQSKPKAAEETITISRDGHKVDLSNIDIRTGALVSFEVFDNEILIKIRR